MSAHVESSGLRKPSEQEIHHIVESHILWQQSGGAEGKRANFRYLDLRGANFAGVSLAEASFRGADVSGASFQGADLTAADFAEAILVQTDMTETRMAGAILTGASMPGVRLGGADMSQSKLDRAQLQSARLERVNLEGASLRECQMEGVTLAHANLSFANLRNAILESADFTSANCAQADFRGANASRARFRDANVDKAVMRGTLLDGVDVNAANFTDALEVANEYYMQAFNERKAGLKQEEARLVEYEGRLRREESHIQEVRQWLQTEYQRIEKIRETEKNLAASYHGYAVSFRRVSLLWGLIAGGFIAICGMVAITLRDLDMASIVLMLLTIFAISALFLFTTLKAGSLSRHVRKHHVAQVEKQQALKGVTQRIQETGIHEAAIQGAKVQSGVVQGGVVQEGRLAHKMPEGRQSFAPASAPIVSPSVKAEPVASPAPVQTVAPEVQEQKQASALSKAASASLPAQPAAPIASDVAPLSRQQEETSVSNSSVKETSAAPIPNLATAVQQNAISSPAPAQENKALQQDREALRQSFAMAEPATSLKQGPALSTARPSSEPATAPVKFPGFGFGKNQRKSEIPPAVQSSNDKPASLSDLRVMPVGDKVESGVAAPSVAEPASPKGFRNLTEKLWPQPASSVAANAVEGLSAGADAKDAGQSSSARNLFGKSAPKEVPSQNGFLRVTPSSPLGDAATQNLATPSKAS